MIRIAFAAVCVYEAVAISTGVMPPITEICRRRPPVSAAMVALFIVHVYWKIENIEKLAQETAEELAT